MMIRFHGMHAHALTNVVFHYDGELTEEGRDLARWRAVVRRGGTVVDTLAGNVAFDPSISTAVQASTAEIHTLIDARDHEKIPLA